MSNNLMSRSPADTLSPEFRLVAAASWMPYDRERQTDLLRSLHSAQLDWAQVTKLVARHGVTGLFCQTMGNPGAGTVPTGAMQHFGRTRFQQAAKNLGQLAELAQICTCFAEAGIDIIPLKGVTLSQEIYGDPVIRPSGDLDVLVRSSDISGADSLLEKLGYRNLLGFHGLSDRQQRFIVKNLHHHEYINDKTGLVVELHWRGYLWSESQVGHLWEESRPLNGYGSTTRRLSREDGILFLADHGARHGWEALKWLADIAMLTEGLTPEEWLRLYRRASCFDLQRVLLQTCLLLERIYGIAPPHGIKELAHADRMAAVLADDGLKQLLATREELAQQVKKFAGLRQMLRLKRLKPATPLSALLYNVTIKPEDFLEVSLPDRLFWLYLLLRPYFWYRRHHLG